MGKSPYSSQHDVNDEPARDVSNLLESANPLSWIERLVAGGIASALVIVGLLVIVSLSTGTGDLTNSELWVALLVGLALALTGAVLSWYSFKRQRDFYEWRMKALQAQSDMMLQGRETRLTQSQKADLAGQVSSQDAVDAALGSQDEPPTEI